MLLRRCVGGGVGGVDEGVGGGVVVGVSTPGRSEGAGEAAVVEGTGGPPGVAVVDFAGVNSSSTT